jgi:transposase
MQPYSMDLRERVFNACKEGKLSRAQIAATFSVCTSWIRRLLQRHRETGSLDPKPHGGGRPAKLKEAALQRLRELIQQQNDVTLPELRVRLGEPVGRSSIARAVVRLGLPLKKSRCKPLSKIDPTLPRSGASIVK